MRALRSLRPFHLGRLGLPFALVALAVGCGSSGGAAGRSDGGSSSTDAAIVDASSADGALADLLVLPLVLGHKSGTLAKPKLVAVTFGGDPQAADIDAFTEAVGGSAYWQAVTGEYGVGPATSGSITAADPAPAMIDQNNRDAEKWLATRFDGTHPEWGAFDPNAVYLVFYPQETQTTPTVGGCGGAYHGSIQATVAHAGDAGSSPANMAYGVVFRCASTIDVGRPTGIDLTTSMASHEMVEAVTDPFGAGYYGTDPNHVAWGYFLGSEVGDMCAFHAGAFIKPVDLGYTVQRSWSNAAARAFQDPCVPGASDPLFLAAPIGLETITLSDSTGGTFSSAGFTVHNGQTRTIGVRLYGGGSGSWTVTPFTYAMEHGQPEPHLQLSLDQATGQSGDVLHLTVARVADDTSGAGGDAVKLVSTAGGVNNEWYFAIAN